MVWLSPSLRGSSSVGERCLLFNHKWEHVDRRVGPLGLGGVVCFCTHTIFVVVLMFPCIRWFGGPQKGCAVDTVVVLNNI